MGEPKRDNAAPPSPPSRQAISKALLADEGPLVESLIERASLSADDRRQIERLAGDLVKAAREGRHEQGGLRRATELDGGEQARPKPAARVGKARCAP